VEEQHEVRIAMLEAQISRFDLTFSAHLFEKFFHFGKPQFPLARPEVSRERAKLARGDLSRLGPRAAPDRSRPRRPDFRAARERFHATLTPHDIAHSHHHQDAAAKRLDCS
jgi:hypothetical protein